MGKPAASHGFTFLETLTVLVVISCLSLLFMGYVPKTSAIMPSFSLKQLQAMARQERINIDSYLWFNADGNINHAQTRHFQQKTCIFQLGFGRYRCE